jgi:hypothetical protein
MTSSGGRLSDHSAAGTRRDSPQRIQLLLAWLVVSVPLLWGIWETIKKAALLFR